MEIPPTMTALALPKYGTPDSYGLSTLETPKITQPDEVLIKVAYASVNPIDVHKPTCISSAID